MLNHELHDDYDDDRDVPLDGSPESLEAGKALALENVTGLLHRMLVLQGILQPHMRVVRQYDMLPEMEIKLGILKPMTGLIPQITTTEQLTELDKVSGEILDWFVAVMHICLGDGLFRGQN